MLVLVSPRPCWADVSAHVAACSVCTLPPAGCMAPYATETLCHWSTQLRAAQEILFSDHTPGVSRVLSCNPSSDEHSWQAR